MVRMNEDEFYRICEKCEELPPLESRYFPTVETLEENVSEENLQSTLIFLIYFSTDPYRNDDIISKDREYKRTVKYAKKFLLEHIELMEAK